MPGDRGLWNGNSGEVSCSLSVGPSKVESRREPYWTWRGTRWRVEGRIKVAFWSCE